MQLVLIGSSLSPSFEDHLCMPFHAMSPGPLSAVFSSCQAFPLHALRGMLEAQYLLQQFGPDNAPKVELHCPRSLQALPAVLQGTANKRMMLSNVQSPALSEDESGATARLSDAVREGSLPRARRFLCKGARLTEAVDAEGNTLLHLASAAGQTEMVQAFLDAGADADVRNRAGESPLFVAAEEGHIGTAEALLKAGAGVDAANLISYTPLHRAACMTQPAMVKLLLHKGASVDALYMTRTRTPTTGSVMHAAVCTHRAAEASDIIAVLDLLLDAGCKVDARDAPDALTPLLLAVGHAHAQPGMVHVCRHLLHRGASGSAQSTTRSTALHLAAYEGQPALVELFLSAGLTNEAVDQLGSTPANVAAWRGMQLALQAGEERADAVLEAYTCCVDLLTGNSSAAIQHPSECSLYQADEQPLTA